MKTPETLRTEARNDIARALGVPPEKLPADVTPGQAGEVLGIKERTLSIWRSTGRYNLPYLKMGRNVRYRVADLVEFRIKRLIGHTGELA